MARGFTPYSASTVRAATNDCIADAFLLSSRQEGYLEILKKRHHRLFSIM
ncbi:MAG: hypothetical protein ABI600_01775 [Luteolibacter sp.]